MFFHISDSKKSNNSLADTLCYVVLQYSKYTSVSMHTQSTHAQSFYTLTINLQPIAQLDGVAMANILPPESSAEIGAREAERGRVILNMR